MTKQKEIYRIIRKMAVKEEVALKMGKGVCVFVCVYMESFIMYLFVPKFVCCKQIFCLLLLCISNGNAQLCRCV